MHNRTFNEKKKKTVEWKKNFTKRELKTLKTTLNNKIEQKMYNTGYCYIIKRKTDKLRYSISIYWYHYHFIYKDYILGTQTYLIQ